MIDLQILFHNIRAVQANKLDELKSWILLEDLKKNEPDLIESLEQDYEWQGEREESQKENLE